MDKSTNRDKARSYKTLRTTLALMLREMETTYGRSPGGYAWAILEPVAGVALLSVIFSMAFSSPALGSNFPLFYATGFLPFMLYTDLSVKLGQAIRFSRPLLFYPSVTYVDTLLARFLLNSITHILVFCIVMFGIHIVYGLQATLNYQSIFNALAMACMLGLGVGTLNCYLLTRFQVWERIWAVLTRPMFIISAIFFLFETVPEPFRGLLWFNPLIHIVGEMRNGFYSYYEVDYVSQLYCFGFSITCLSIGLLLLFRNHRTLINHY